MKKLLCQCEDFIMDGLVIPRLDIFEDDIVSVPAFQVSAFQEEPKIACGAGDSFNAGLIYGLLLDLQLEDQLILANAVAALYLSSSDSNPPNKSGVLQFLKSEPALSSSGKKLLME